MSEWFDKRVTEHLYERSDPQIDIKVTLWRDSEGNGIGLANTRARLQALYGGDALLAIDATSTGGTRVRLRLPRRHGDVVATRTDGVHGFRFDEVRVP